MIMDRFSELSVRERVMLMLAVAAILAVGAERLVFSPAYKKIRILDTRIAAERVNRSSYLDALVETNEVATAYDKVRDRLGESGPADEENEQLKRRLDQLAIENGITIRARKHKPPVEDLFVVTYTVQVGEFEGPADALVKMLQAIEEADGLLRVDQLSIKIVPEKKGIVTGSMRVTQVMTRAAADEEGS